MHSTIVCHEPFSACLHVLLVEDNPVDAQIVQRKLDDDPFFTYVIYHAVNLSEARNLLRSSEKIDITLLDLNLPDSIDGFYTLEQILAEKCAAPVIVMTGHGDRFLAVDLLEKGAEDFISKSTFGNDDRRLTDTITYAMRRHARVYKQEQQAESDEKSEEAILEWIKQGS